MRRNECPREPELLDALRSGAWPDDIPHDLRGHVERCASCDALAELVAPLLGDHHALTRDAAVPSSSAMWWRLQLRARREAADRAMRPIAAVQGLALAGGAGLLATAVGYLAPKPVRLMAWLNALADGAAAAGSAALPSTTAHLLSPGGLALAMTAALLLVVVPVAIYLALSDR